MALMMERMEIDTNIINTVPKLFSYRVEESGSDVAFWSKEYGLWKSYTWYHYYKMARLSGLALLSMGLKRGERIAIISENRPEWVYTDLGCTCVGGVCTGVYPTNSPAQLRYILDHSEAKFLFVEDEEQLDKALAIMDDVPTLEKIILYDDKGLDEFKHPLVLKLEQFIEIGKEEEMSDKGLFERLMEEPGSDDLAIIVYTSGTTGPPKGAMLTHRNILWVVSTFFHPDRLSPEDEHLSCFPLCHVLERFLTIYHSLYQGYVVNFAESQEAIPKNLQEVQPTILFAVPRFWEKFYSSIRSFVGDAVSIERWIYEKAMNVGYRVARLKLERRPLSGGLRILYRLADWFVFRNIKKMIGLSKGRHVFSGGAPISHDLLMFFHAIGLPIREAYGQTENVVISVHQGGDITPGTVGKPLPGLEVKIAKDGEILSRGPNTFMGYLKDTETTSETIVDGWLHTGDVGEFDDKGHLKITDRKKDIIITAGGKNITPSEIENQLKFSPYINDGVVIGDKRKYLTALIMVDEDNVRKYAQNHRIPFTTYASLTENQEIIKLIQTEVDKVNNRLARVESIKKFRLLGIQLTPEDDEVTPTMKLKRNYVNEKFKDLIDSMY